MGRSQVSNKSNGVPLAMEKQAYMVISVVLAIALVASVVVLGVLPMFQPARPQVQRIDIDMVDFAFGAIDTNPEYRVSASVIVLVVLTNKGAAEHEFMLVTSKDTALTTMQNLANQINNNASYTTTEEKMAAFMEAHEMMEMAYQGIEMDVEPGETVGLAFVIEDPGTYYIVCHEVEGTWPQLHQSVGMWGTLIVEGQARSY